MAISREEQERRSVRLRRTHEFEKRMRGLLQERPITQGKLDALLKEMEDAGFMDMPTKALLKLARGLAEVVTPVYIEALLDYVAGAVARASLEATPAHLMPYLIPRGMRRIGRFGSR